MLRSKRPLHPLLPSLLAATAAVTAIGATGCGTRGSGTPATEVREVEAFERIDVSGAVELIVHVAPDGPQKLEITADDNLVPLLETRVQGHELEVGFGPNMMIRPKVGVRVEAWVPSLTAIDASGATDVEVEGLHGAEFSLDVSGASDTILRGSVDRLDVDISGAGELEAKELVTKIVRLELSGAGEATVWASESLDVDISGAGEVTYFGEPANIIQDISGSGELKSGG